MLKKLSVRPKYSEDAVGGGGGKKILRGGRKTSRMTPLPKRGFGPLISALFLLYKSPRLSRPEALLGGSRNFREGACLVRFPPPIHFAPPPMSWPKVHQNSMVSGMFPLIALTQYFRGSPNNLSAPKSQRILRL